MKVYKRKSCFVSKERLDRARKRDELIKARAEALKDNDKFWEKVREFAPDKSYPPIYLSISDLKESILLEAISK